MDPSYGFEAVNVEAQTRDRSSLLNWMRRMLLVRKSSQAFGRGSLRFIRPGNRRVLVYLRQYGEDTILYMVNLSRSAQPVEIALAEYKGTMPIELLGNTAFPPVGELPYFLTLPAYGFYWFRLSREAQAPPWHDERMAPEDLPVLVLVEGWACFFTERVATWRQNLAMRLRVQLESRVIPHFVATQRWYAGKGTPIVSAKLSDYGLRESSLDRWLAAIFLIESATESNHYFIPLAIAVEEGEETRWKMLQPAAIARVRQQATVGVLADACLDVNFCWLVVDAIGASAELATHTGLIRCTATSLFPELRGDPGAVLTVTAGPGQSSNSTVRVGDQFLLKIYRKLQPGENPELEIGRYLTEVARFPNIVPVAGAVEYRAEDGTLMTLALLQAFVMNQGDGWDYTVNYLVRFLEDRRTGTPLPEDAHGLYLSLMRTLAIRTAELHVALSRPTDNPAFAPEPITATDIQTWKAHTLAEAEKTFSMLSDQLARLPNDVAIDAESLLKRRALLERQIEASAARVPTGLKTRRHGDYHLGQVLLRRNDFILVDFEGEPGRTPAERRLKHSPLTDVAGMLRSFTYARRVVLFWGSQVGPNHAAMLEPLLDNWEQQTRQTFIAAYDDVACTHGLYTSLEEMRPLLQLFEIEKALYEVRYELGNRPDWASIPLRSLIAFA